MSREKTVDEVRHDFLEYVVANCRYWERAAGVSLQDRIEGIAYSIMVAIDGEAIDLPAFTLEPKPHEDDQEFRQDRGEDWYPIGGDIGGSLHEVFLRIAKEAP